MHITLKKNHTRTGLIVLGLALAVGLLLAVSVTTQRISRAAPVPESCFTFDSGAGEITEYNPTSDPLCLANLDIPATIGGVPVTTIDSNAFVDDVVTSVSFPASITLIESGAFNNIDNALTAVTLDVSGDLLIEDGAFGELNGTVVSISADGNLEYRSNFDASVLTSFTLHAGGNLLATNSSTPITSIDTLSVTADGNIDINGGALGGSTVGAATVTAGGTITITSGGLDSATYDSLEITGVGDVTINGSITGFATSVETITVESGAALYILGGTFSNIGNLTTASLTAGSGILSIEDGSMGSIATLTTLTLTAPSGLDILDGSLASLPALTAINFPSLGGDVFIYGLTFTGLTAFDMTTTGSVEITFGAFGNSSDLASFDVTAGGDIDILNSTISNLPALATMTLDAGGTLTLNGGTVNGLPVLTSFSATSGGDMSIINGSVYGTSAETVSLISGGALTISGGALTDNDALTTVTLESDGNLSIGSGAASTNYALESLDITSGGTTTISDGAFAYTQLSDLSLESVGDLTLGASVFQFGQLTSLTLPSSLVSIGTSAFRGNPLAAVYLNSSPTIGLSAFSYAGVNYDPIGTTYSNLDQVMYVPLYVSVAHSYTNTNHADTDLDSDSIDDIAGGYLINPAQISLSYQDADGNSVSTGSFALGELTDGTPLLTYLVSDNPTEDLSFYYFVGDEFTFSAPVIAGFPTPADQTVTLGAGLNTVSFVYALEEQPGVPDTGLAPLNKITPLAVIAAGVTVIGLAVLIVLRLRTRTR